MLLLFLKNSPSTKRHLYKEYLQGEIVIILGVFTISVYYLVATCLKVAISSPGYSQEIDFLCLWKRNNVFSKTFFIKLKVIFTLNKILS